MDLKSFKVWARETLGDSGCGYVNVELSDKQLDTALDTAKEWFNAHVGLHKESTFTLVAGTSEYDLSAVSPAIDTIVNVWFPRSGVSLDFSVLYPGFLDIEGFPYRDIGIFGENFPQTTIVQNLQYMESLGRILCIDLDWEFYRDDFDKDNPVRMLRVMRAPRVGGTCVYLYRVDPKDIKLHMYKPRDLYIMREYALAHAKYMLGRIRGKYTTGLPAAGGDRQLDGDSLLSEAREDKERLEQKILDHDGPIMPVIG
jgi:hypothetical protein